MKASEVKSMAMIRNALLGIPASGASNINEIVFNGGSGSDAVLGYDCGIPEKYASDLSTGGKHVLVGDMNRILQLAGTGLYLRQRGASNEFDERVVAIDRGGKGDGDHWGYPNGAIIDWWDGSTFQKVICIKSGEGENNGNCTDGPDDPVYGINGSSETKYWQLVERPTQQTFRGYESCGISDVATHTSSGWLLNKFARIRLQWSANIIHRDVAGTMISYALIDMYLKPNDTIGISGTSVTVNSNTVSPTSANIATNGQVSGSLSLVYDVFRCVWNQ